MFQWERKNTQNLEIKHNAPFSSGKNETHFKHTDSFLRNCRLVNTYTITEMEVDDAVK